MEKMIGTWYYGSAPVIYACGGSGCGSRTISKPTTSCGSGGCG